MPNPQPKPEPAPVPITPADDPEPIPGDPQPSPDQQIHDPPLQPEKDTPEEHHLIGAALAARSPGPLPPAKSAVFTGYSCGWRLGRPRQHRSRQQR